MTDNNSNTNGVKYHYNDDEEDEFNNNFPGDKEEQSLVPNSNFERDNAYHKKKENRKRVFMGSLFLLLSVWLVWTVGLSQMRPADEPDEQNSKKYIDLPDLYNDSFTVQRPTLVWVKNDPRDGIFTYTDPVTNDIMLESVEDGKIEVFVKKSDLKVDDGYLEVNSFEISQDAQYLLLKTNVTSQWRHSTFSNIYIYKLADKSLTPLSELSTVASKPLISYAAWSPTGHHLAYVIENEIYITDLRNVTRVTFDGSPTIFNGKPDWVYEEEVFARDYAIWWSPDSTHLAYLRFNETDVPEFHLQYYTTSNSSYPEEVALKYPKAGSPNPLVSLHIYSLRTNSTIDISKSSVRTAESYIELDENDRLITDVVWSTESHTHLLFKQMSRVQDIEITSLVTIGKSTNETLLEHLRTYKPDDGGWIEPSQTMVYMPNSHDDAIHYLDIIDNESGYMHLAFLSTQADPVWLTSGDWEVIAGSAVVDQKRQLIHYTSTERSSLERHLYKIDLGSKDPASTKECITCSNDDHGYYSAIFSPKFGYYVLQYDGPGIPTTVVKKVNNSTFETVLQDNAALGSLLKNYDLPKTRMVSVNSGGVDTNAMEIVPPGFDASKKYPVLFHVYGGPNSQLVSHRFELSWSTYLAGKLDYIVVTVDGRGTGFRGRKYRSGVRGRLGELETIDQINAARHWSQLSYVDPSRIAIWGWSYGGYMTSKVIEANSGIYAAGLVVAPVTDWRFYDSIYTERYMLTPQLNPEGYNKSAVNDMTGFENARYLLIHGTGDDNVHFQNSAVLVDKLTQADIHNYQVQFYTDNTHAIRYHNANQQVYNLLTEFLTESFGGEEYVRVRKEHNGHFSGPLPK